MIILAAAIIISLSNNGIIDKANEAVDKNNIKQVETMSNLAWSEAYMDGVRSKKGLEAAVKSSLKAAGIAENIYDVNVTETGVEIAPATTPIYFGKLYSMEESGTTLSLVAYKDGSVEAYFNKQLQDVFQKGVITFDGLNIYQEGQLFGTISQDGTRIDIGLGVLELDNSWCLHNSVEIINETSTYHGDVYCYECGKTISSLEHRDIIPEGGMYYVGLSKTPVGDYEGATQIYGPGDPFPQIMNTGDVYAYGDYEYRYNYVAGLTWGENSSGKWGAHVVNVGKTRYSTPLASINDKEINMAGAFFGCKNLLDLSNIIIPKNATSLSYTFAGCSSLKSIDGLQIPNGVQNMEAAFYGCTSLTDVSNLVIPNSVNNISSLFAQCSNLIKVPVLKNNITNMDGIYSACKLLTSVNVPVSVTSIDDWTFRDCESLVTIKYNGTIEQWQAITFTNAWNDNTGNYTIYCTNGTIAKDGTITYN